MDKDAMKHRTKRIADCEIRNRLRRKYAQPELRVVVFHLAGHEHVVDAAQVHEIIRPTNLIRMGSAPHYVEGLVKRQGRIVPVVDLRKRLGLSASSPTVDTCVIITKLPVGPVGLLVDAATELMWVKTRDFEVPSKVVAGIDEVYIQGVAHLGDRLLVMLDLAFIFTHDEQEELGELGDLPLDTIEDEDEVETLFTGGIGEAATEGEEDRSIRQVGDQASDGQKLHSLIAFELSGELYGVPITDVREISEPLPLMPLPNVPAHVLGLINLRGVVLPVIDLRRKFELSLQPDGPDSRLIVVKGPGYPVALRVDAVRDLARLPQVDFQPAPPDVARIDPEYYEQVAVLDSGEMLIELNVEELLADTAAREHSVIEAIPFK